MAKKEQTYNLTDEQFQAVCIKRARAVMKLHGVKDADTRSVCVNAFHGHGSIRNRPNITDDELAAIARQIADDTSFWG